MISETSQRLRRSQRFWSDILPIRGRRLMKAIRADQARAALIDRLRQETLRLKARTPGSWFDPDQPRLPRGQSGGGRWTNTGQASGAGARVASRNARPTFFVIPSPVGPLRANPRQTTDYQAARHSADAAVAYARSLDPNFRPTPHLYGTVRGAIAGQRSTRDQANAFIANFLRDRPSFPAFPPGPGIGHNGGPPLAPPTIQLLAPGGQPIGTRASGAGPAVRTIDRSTFDNLIWNLTEGSMQLPLKLGYEGRFYILPDRCIFGLRMSDRYGLTIDIPRHESFPFRDFRVHYGIPK